MIVYSKKCKKRLYPAQAELVQEMVDAEGPYLYNGSDVGTGKTPMGFVYANSIHAERVLWVTTASLRLQTAMEAQTWYCKSKSVPFVFSGTKDIQRIQKNLRRNVGYAPSPVIVSYTLLSSPPVKKYIMSRQWDLIIFDEWHEARGAGLLHGNVSKILESCCDILENHNKRVLFMSATPIMRTAQDLYPTFLHIAPQLTHILTDEGIETLMNFHDFVRRYTYYRETPYGPQVKGVRNAHELKDIFLEGGFYWRLEKEDIQDDLPEKSFEPFYLDLKLSSSIEPEVLKQFLSNFENDLTSIEEPKVISVLKKELGLAIANSKDFYDFVYSFINAGHPIILACYHVDVIKTIAEKLKKENPQLIYGEISPTKRETAKETFMSGKSDVLIVNIEAGGTGHNLERAADVIFVETHPLPFKNLQMFGRIDRVTQKSDKISARFIVTDNDFHKEFLGSMISKIKNVDKVGAFRRVKEDD